MIAASLNRWACTFRVDDVATCDGCGGGGIR